LADYVGKREILAVCVYDISNVFDSLIHSEAMLELIRRGVAVDFLGLLFYMYHHLKVRLKIEGSIVPVDIPMYIGII